MPIITIFLCLLTAETEVRKVDELSIKRFFFAAQNQQHVAFSYASGGMSFEMGIYDFKTDRVVLVRDGRIKLFIAFPIPWQEGFAVLNTIGGTAHFIQADGTFVKKATWTGFKGWQPNYKLSYLAPMGEAGKALATIVEKDEDRYLLAVFDVNHQTVEIIYSQPIDDPDLQRYWLPYQDGLISIVPQTEQIDRLRKDNFKSIETLRIARDVLKKKRGSRGGMHIKLLDQPIQVNDAMYFRWLPYRDPLNQSEEVVEPRTLMLKDGKVTAIGAYTIGVYGDKRIGFYWEDSELKVAQ